MSVAHDRDSRALCVFQGVLLQFRLEKTDRVI